MRIRRTAVVLGLLFLLGSGCISPGIFARRHWDLLVTEVGKREVELYMDEAPSSALDLTGMTFEWTGANGNHGTLKLDTFNGSMAGETFLVIWEDPGYSGSGEAAPYVGGTLPSVPGIRVPAGFFHDIDNYPSEVRVHGERVVAGVAHRVSDVFRFGLPVADRPVTGGNYSNDGSQSGYPSGSGSLQRKWYNNRPLDTDSESDWKAPSAFGTGWPQNWGGRTP